MPQGLPHAHRRLPRSSPIAVVDRSRRRTQQLERGDARPVDQAAGRRRSRTATGRSTRSSDRQAGTSRSRQRNDRVLPPPVPADHPDVPRDHAGRRSSIMHSCPAARSSGRSCATRWRRRRGRRRRPAARGGVELPQDAIEEIRATTASTSRCTSATRSGSGTSLHLDLGNSYIYQDPVWDVIKSRFPDLDLPRPDRVSS